MMTTLSCNKVVLLAAAALAALWAGGAQALDDIPPHLRGGLAWKLRQREVRAAAAQEAFPYKYFTSACDHSGGPSACTFQQRYKEDLSHQRNGSNNVVLYISGEAEMTGAPGGGFTGRLAEELGAPVFAVEHRFYGHSIPGNDVTDAGMRLLSVDQALSDLAGFLDQLKANGTVPADARVLAVGGSYSGALSSWFRRRFPDKVHAAWSSSGVVNAVFDYTQFDVDVSLALSDECRARVRNVSEGIDARLAASPASAAAVKALFGAPASLPITDFLYAVADSWSMAVQYGHKTDLCAALQEDGDPVEVFAAVSERLWGLVGRNCFYSTACIRATQSTANVTDVGSRSWRWAKCSQLAYLQAAPSGPLGSLRSPLLTLESQLQQCRDMFGGMSPNGTDAFNKRWGGADPAGQTRTVYFDAHDDPWKSASVQGPVGTCPYVFINCTDCGHCIDLHAPAPSDPPSLTEGRTTGLEWVRKWFA